MSSGISMTDLAVRPRPAPLEADPAMVARAVQKLRERHTNSRYLCDSRYAFILARLNTA